MTTHKVVYLPVAGQYFADKLTDQFVLGREELAIEMARFVNWLSTTSMTNADIPDHIKARMFIDQQLIQPSPQTTTSNSHGNKQDSSD